MIFLRDDDEAKNRSVAVHTGAIVEALRNLYEADDLTREITNYE